MLRAISGALWCARALGSRLAVDVTALGDEVMELFEDEAVVRGLRPGCLASATHRRRGFEG